MVSKRLKNRKTRTHCLQNKPNINIHYLEAFYHVAKLGGFSAAADAMDVSKGLVSRHVRQLEISLNTQLFYRTTRFVKLTEAGEQLYDKAEHIFLLAREAEQDILDVTQDSSGTLRFTSPISMGERIIGGVLPKFQALCPNVNIIFNFTSTAFNVSQGEQDIALRASADLPEDVVAKYVGMIRNVLVASPRYLQKHGQPESIERINTHPCILFNHQRSWDTWQLHQQPYQEDHYTEVQIQGSVHVNQYTTARHLALLDQGIANLPLYIVQQDITEQRLIPIFDEYVIPMHPLYIIHASQRRVPGKIQLFKQVLIQWFTDNPEVLIPVVHYESTTLILFILFPLRMLSHWMNVSAAILAVSLRANPAKLFA